MALRFDRVRGLLAQLDEGLHSVALPKAADAARAVERWHAEAAAVRFHLRERNESTPLVAILGGTGTGKSTLVNRLVNTTVSATSFRRTFTSGPVAVTRTADALPTDWLALPRRTADNGELPARGQAGELIVVPLEHALTERLALIDTPDLDGDQPIHVAEADRVFRWAQAAVFLVTPEKYQMTELLPYYRLARRYHLPSLFVMNKCEESAVLDDYRAMLARRDWPDARVFSIARDDAAYEPPPDDGLPGLERALRALEAPTANDLHQGLPRRCGDLMERLRDHVLTPLGEDRRRVNRLEDALQALRTPPGGVDVSPLTQQLQRRMQEQSVLYLMGPGRMVERVRQLPGILARLPRTAWGYIVRGEAGALVGPASTAQEAALPDFARLLADQFVVVQSRIDDVLRGDPVAGAWLEARADSYGATRIEPVEASRIAEEELAELRAWLEHRWNAAPRDTQVIQKLLGLLPGGRKITRWSEAAPYLLAVAVAAHGAIFGPVDLMIIGGWSVATWLGEKLSNEVTARTRRTNHRIAERFDQLAREQLDKVAEWLDAQAPDEDDLDRLRKLADAISEETAG